MSKEDMAFMQRRMRLEKEIKERKMYVELL